MSPAALDLAEQLLAYDPSKRASAIQAMEAPYFNSEEPEAERPYGYGKFGRFVKFLTDLFPSVLLILKENGMSWRPNVNEPKSEKRSEYIDLCISWRILSHCSIKFMTRRNNTGSTGPFSETSNDTFGQRVNNVLDDVYFRWKWQLYTREGQDAARGR